MKKVLSTIMAAALVASMSVTAFAAAGNAYDSDGKVISGMTVLDTNKITGEQVNPDSTIYYSLGESAATDTIVGAKSGLTKAELKYITNKDYFKFSVDKDENSKMIKSITVVTEKSIEGNRQDYLKIVLNDSTTTSEMKVSGKVEFKAKAASTSYTGSKAVAAATNVWDANATLTIPYTLWVNNTEKKGSDESADTGDRIYFNPADNETNSLVWGDDRAAVKFDANDDASKFYARLSTKSDSEMYAQYGDPQNADLWFYDFVGNPTIPSTSRATLTLGIPWDTDADYVPNVSDVFIYEKDADGVLTDVTSKFTYSEDATDIEGWSIKTRTLGTYIISDTELDLAAAETEESASEATSSTATTDGGKEIPNTGSSDMVNVAVVAAVVSLAAAGAVAFRKAK
ncbi:LPXTG cell wall anchor domain-containing protein [Oscillospiraceae bacterium PP1C4]